MNREKYICPKCRKNEGVRIIYGYPSDELREAWYRKEIALGGCNVTDENPLYQCMKCNHQW